MSKKNILVALILIILLGAFLRFYKLGETSFVADEFLDINSSYAYAKTGIWQNWDFNFGKVNEENAFAPRDERAWIYKWQVASLFKFLPPTEATARTISAIWGIISIILIYFVANYFTKKKEIGLISAFLFAISISGIIFDRRLRMYAMFFAVFLAFSWMFFKFLEERYEGKSKLIKSFWDKFGFNLIYLIPAIVLGFISILTHQLTANIVFIFTIYAIIQIIIKIKNKESWFNKYLVSILIMIFAFIGGMLAIPKQMGEYTAGLQFFNNHWSYFIKVFTDYNNLLIAVGFLVIGIYFLYKKEKLQKETLWLSASFLGILTMAMFIWSRNVGDQYIFFFQSFEIILIASGIYFTADFFGKNIKDFGKKTFIISIVLSLLLLPNYAYFFHSENTYNQTSESDNPNYRKIFAYFKKARNEDDVLITRNFRNYYWSGEKVKVFDFGGELVKEKLSLDEIKKITSENPSGWFIISENDDAYISNEAMNYIEKNFEKVSNVAVRGKVLVYKWSN